MAIFDEFLDRRLSPGFDVRFAAQGLRSEVLPLDSTDGGIAGPVAPGLRAMIVYPLDMLRTSLGLFYRVFHVADMLQESWRMRNSVAQLESAASISKLLIINALRYPKGLSEAQRYSGGSACIQILWIGRRRTITALLPPIVAGEIREGNGVVIFRGKTPSEVRTGTRGRRIAF